MSDDPIPVEYYNPHARPEPADAKEQAPAPPPLPMSVIPAEFDALLTRSNDHPALNAVEAALRARKIAFHRSDDGRPTARDVLLHVKAADYEQAAQVAGSVFARRARVKELLPPKPSAPQAPMIDGDAIFDPLVIDVTC